MIPRWFFGWWLRIQINPERLQLEENNQNTQKHTPAHAYFGSKFTFSVVGVFVFYLDNDDCCKFGAIAFPLTSSFFFLNLSPSLLIN